MIMFGRHEELVLGGADGAARSLQASLLRPPPLRGPIAEFVGTIAQMPLPCLLVEGTGRAHSAWRAGPQLIKTAKRLSNPRKVKKA